ncbi:MAG: ribbon-helix-helix protein, CopG family [Nitrospirota bacterium]
MGKTRVTITVDEVLVKEVDLAAVKHHENRSHIMEKALRYWHRRQKELELTKGYQAMAKEDKETAEANLSAGIEVLK